MDKAVANWRERGDYLPKFLRDFHDQKDAFKALHISIDVEGHEYAGQVSWVAGQCYVIDVFLWWMAQHGYVLRKSTANLPFDDLGENITAANSRRFQQEAAMLNSVLQSNTEERP